jgi:hypothetical protein
MPDAVLELVNLDRELLERTPKLLEEFREYRLEKSTIKSIKYKVEIIKASSEDWRVIDKVCRALAVGNEKEKEQLRYRKYRHLELSNLKHIEVISVGLRGIPNWVVECHNLQTLDLS